jgi:hypothetical protein
MPGNNSNLSTVDMQQATTATTTANRKEEDAVAAAHAAIAIAHREQEALIAAMATTCRTLDEAWAHERTAALTWEKEKTITRHLEQ